MHLLGGILPLGGAGGYLPEKNAASTETCGTGVGAKPNTSFLCAAHHPVSLHGRKPQIKSLERRTWAKLSSPNLPPDSVEPKRGSFLVHFKGKSKSKEHREPATCTLTHTI